jgi:hypothetical protein
VSLTYSNEWLKRGFPLSEDLPLHPGEFFPTKQDTAVGAVDDARPDRWGERVIRFLDRPQRLSTLEYLYFAGDDRFGALGVSVSQDQYSPRAVGPLPTVSDVSTIHKLAMGVMTGEPIAAHLNLETAIDRLLPMEMSYLFELYSSLMFHQMGEHATHPIARFSGRQALLLRLAWNGHAALSPLQGASALARADRSAGGQHAVRNPCYTLARRPEKRTLGHVQSPFLG